MGKEKGSVLKDQQIKQTQYASNELITQPYSMNSIQATYPLTEADFLKLTRIDSPIHYFVIGLFFTIIVNGIQTTARYFAYMNEDTKSIEKWEYYLLIFLIVIFMVSLIIDKMSKKEKQEVEFRIKNHFQRTPVRYRVGRG